MSFLDDVEAEVVDRRVGCKLCTLLDEAGIRADVDAAFTAGLPYAAIHRALAKRGIAVGRSTVERHSKEGHHEQ